MNLKEQLTILAQYLAAAWQDPILRADVEREFERLREEENE